MGRLPDNRVTLLAGPAAGGLVGVAGGQVLVAKCWCRVLPPVVLVASGGVVARCWCRVPE